MLSALTEGEKWFRIDVLATRGRQDIMHAKLASDEVPLDCQWLMSQISMKLSYLMTVWRAKLARISNRSNERRRNLHLRVDISPPNKSFGSKNTGKKLQT